MDHDLIKVWREDKLIQPPYILKADFNIFQRSYSKIVVNDKEEYENLNQNEKKYAIHAGLLPSPFGGNLENADIFLLYLNPGFHPCEYEFEMSNKPFKNSLIKQIRQNNAKIDFPFISLNPDFSGHPGFAYFADNRSGILKRERSNLRHIGNYLINSKRKEFIEMDSIDIAYKYLSNRIAILEYFPYHSKNYNHDKLARDLESSRLIVDYAQSVLVPKAKRGKILIVCTRKALKWNLPNHKNIIIYDKSWCQSASLSLKSPGGIAIKAFIESRP